jgi:hypothetical protein
LTQVLLAPISGDWRGSRSNKEYGDDSRWW